MIKTLPYEKEGAFSDFRLIYLHRIAEFWSNVVGARPKLVSIGSRFREMFCHLHFLDLA